MVAAVVVAAAVVAAAVVAAAVVAAAVPFGYLLHLAAAEHCY